MAATNFDAHGLEDDVTYDATESEDGNWGTFRVIGVLVLFAAFSGFVYLAYVQGLQNGRNAPQTIAAPEGDYKVQPDEPGGQSFAQAQSKTIHDRVNGADTDVTGASAIAPPEQPMDLGPATAAGGPEETDMASLGKLDEQPLVTGATPLPTRRPEGLTASIKADPVEATEPTASREEVTDIAALTEPEQTSPAGDIASAGIDPTSGAYLLQLASFPERGLAEQAWGRVNAKHSDLLVGLGPDYQAADIPGKGTYHRLRIGPFRSKAEATEVCNALKARKQDCIPRKN